MSIEKRVINKVIQLIQIMSNKIRIGYEDVMYHRINKTDELVEYLMKHKDNIINRAKNQQQFRFEDKIDGCEDDIDYLCFIVIIELEELESKVSFTYARDLLYQAIQHVKEAKRYLNCEDI